MVHLMSIIEELEIKMLDFHRQNGKSCTTIILSCNLIQKLTKELQSYFGNIVELETDYILHTPIFDCCYKGKKIVRVIENNIISVI